ncbi:hypothetical protein [Hyphomicrobium sp.]|jgi:hypothetical protein|uniref:hypothetical protein n=1 Tax=Hyphomicrobium sp. TaxID=82 RepID=UPI002C800108|nr:hypothetical protein [Hyphomicrobium sp.]HVZ05687.1 hypothetical protein [Hyphomicrobium sp.]
MKMVTRFARWAIVAVSLFGSGAAFADETNSKTAQHGAVATNSLSPDALGRDPLLQQPASDDLFSRVDALEASRATVEQKSKPPISLSISGWVDQQVTYTHQ